MSGPTNQTDHREEEQVQRESRAPYAFSGRIEVVEKPGTEDSATIAMKMATWVCQPADTLKVISRTWPTTR